MKLLRLDGSVLNSVDFKIRVNSELFITETKYFMKFILLLYLSSPYFNNCLIV